MKAALTYHSIDDSGSPISVSPATFAAHLRWLSSGRVRVLSLDDLVGHPDHQDDAVAVTFDDGLVNTRGAVEQLRAAGVPVTLFVVSGRVGGTNAWRGVARTDVPTLPLFGWSDLEQLAARGATIEAHTRTHPSLTAVSSAALDDELGGCVEELRARLGVQCAHIAYPYGDVSDTVAARAARHFRCGYTTEFRGMADADAPLRLPRLDMYYFQAPGVLESWGSRRFTRHVAWCRMRRAIRAHLRGGLGQRQRVIVR